MIFLDTTVLIDLLRNKAAAIDFLNKRLQEKFFTSEINIFELIEGVYSGSFMVKDHLDQIEKLAGRLTVLSFDRPAALRAGLIAGKLSKNGDKIGEIDCLIAGITLANNIKAIVTENQKHFAKIEGLAILTY